jgi:hypothetical protein
MGGRIKKIMMLAVALLLSAAFALFCAVKFMPERSLPQPIQKIVAVNKTYQGEQGVTVTRIAVPAPWNKIESNDFVGMQKMPHGVYKTEHHANHLDVFVLLESSGAATLQSPAVKFQEATLAVSARLVNVAPDEPVCCVDVYAFKFQIPNPPINPNNTVFNLEQP